MKRFILLAALFGAIAPVIVAPAAAQSPVITWHMVGGVSSTPKAFVAESGFCDVAAVYNFTDSQQWEIWFAVSPELEFLNDDFIMVPNRGYWVACRY